MAINQVEKKDYTAQKISYTSKDYTNILEELIESIPSISKKWQTTDENDPGMVLVKLMSILGDMLFYNLDIQSLEVYPNTVIQRKNAASIFKLIGYKMKWYRSAVLKCNIVNTYTSSATIPRFCTFTTDNNITYCTFKQYELESNTTNNGFESLIDLVQGIPITPVRATTNPYPDNGKAWHTIYDYNYTSNDVIDNRIYLDYANIDQDHIIIIDNNGDEWALKDNIYLTRDIGKFFEFGVDVNDRPYVELIDYWQNYNVTKFKIFYIRSMGVDGQIFANTLKNITGNVWAKTGVGTEQTVYNVNNFINFTHFDSSFGYNPETPNEARKNSVVYQNTMDTLITLADFERATLREMGVANVRATDLTNDPGIFVTNYIGDINQDGVIDSQDWDMLNNYLTDSVQYPLTSYQRQLADTNQDGAQLNQADLNCIQAYIDGNIGEAGPYIGQQTIKTLQTLDGFVVKLYILREEAYEEYDDEAYANQIITDLQQYKILPLTIQVDLHSIQKFYWTIRGKFYTKEPLARDELQTIIVNINNQLRYDYSLDKMNFNTLINYREVLGKILDVDNRILMVDLDPIIYTDEDGNELSKEALTCVYKMIVPMLQKDPSATDYLHYEFDLEHTTVLPGSLMISVNGGQTILRDDNNGEIYNTDSILQNKGSINYVTGKVDLLFNSPIGDDLVVTYQHNKTNIATYRNLSTHSFSFDTSALKQDSVNIVV